jgi:hypothetical protein
MSLSSIEAGAAATDASTLASMAFETKNYLPFLKKKIGGGFL